MIKNKVKTKSYAKVVVQNSKIHGKGLFAGEDIRKDTILGDLSGKKTVQDSIYTLWVSEDEGFSVECDFKYINHKTTPNVAYYDDFTVVALKNIKEGEELFHDYGWEHD